MLTFRKAVPEDMEILPDLYDQGRAAIARFGIDQWQNGYPAREDIEKAEGNLVGMYDMYFTSYKKNFPISHMVVNGKTICGYTESKSCDLRACEEHLETMLKQSGYKDMTIKIFSDRGKYCERLKQLNGLEHEKTPERDDEVRVVLYDISL